MLAELICSANIKFTLLSLLAAAAVTPHVSAADAYYFKLYRKDDATAFAVEDWDHNCSVFNVDWHQVWTDDRGTDFRDPSIVASSITTAYNLPDVGTVTIHFIGNGLWEVRRSRNGRGVGSCSTNKMGGDLGCGKGLLRPYLQCVIDDTKW